MRTSSSGSSGGRRTCRSRGRRSCGSTAGMKGEIIILQGRLKIISVPCIYLEFEKDNLSRLINRIITVTENKTYLNIFKKHLVFPKNIYNKMHNNDKFWNNFSSFKLEILLDQSMQL